MMRKQMLMVFMFMTIGLLAITINIPADYATIQDGLDASEDGDEIIAAPGTYVENINFAGKAVILGSWFYTTQDTSYISQTIIDGNQNDSEEDSTSILIGFTLTNGQAYAGGGIYCYSSSPALENMTIIDNSAEWGGAIYCEYSNPGLANVIIMSDSAFGGGGIYCSNSSPGLMNVTIMSDSASYGGGIYCEVNSSPSLENVTITDNSAYSGGGIYCWGNSCLSLENVTITNNFAGYYGGGICCLDNSSLNLENVIITDNYAEDSGGGIFCYHSSPNLAIVMIRGNAAGFYGGGVCCSDFSSMGLANVTITNNSASNGGGIYCNSSSPDLANVTVTDNSASYGGGILCFLNSSPTLVNCIFWHNSPQEVEFLSDYNPNTIAIAFSDIEGGEEGIETNNNGTINWLDGNIDADPMFMDDIEGDYHLTEGSPCIDAGIAYFEYAGEVLIDLSENEYYGAAPDIGAYESPFTAIQNHEIEPVKDCMTIYPNPFNPETNINFELLSVSNVLLEIYNIKGQKVTTLVNESFNAGSHKVIWNAENHSSGIYLLRCITAKKSEIKKLILLK